MSKMSKPWLDQTINISLTRQEFQILNNLTNTREEEAEEFIKEDMGKHWLCHLGSLWDKVQNLRGVHFLDENGEYVE
tara:strand:+ start:296 stop:526 length:231 start_codon:yes stop_codon:yes gene_type:complete